MTATQIVRRCIKCSQPVVAGGARCERHRQMHNAEAKRYAARAVEKRGVTFRVFITIEATSEKQAYKELNRILVGRGVSWVSDVFTTDKHPDLEQDTQELL